MSSHPESADHESLLDALAAAGVDFIVVGGVAALLHGAPVATQDVDVVHRTDPDNIERLLRLLKGIGGRVRDPAGRELDLDPAALHGGGQVKLATRHGPLDLLCRLHDGRGYAELIGHTVELSDGSITLRVLDLPTLIAVKAGTGRLRDQLSLPLLKALARERADEDA